MTPEDLRAVAALARATGCEIQLHPEGFLLVRASWRRTATRLISYESALAARAPVGVFHYHIDLLLLRS